VERNDNSLAVGIVFDEPLNVQRNVDGKALACVYLDPYVNKVKLPAVSTVRGGNHSYVLESDI